MNQHSEIETAMSVVHSLSQLADDAGPHICLLKTHVDIMSNFTAATADSLIQLAVKHDFIIMEDRYIHDNRRQGKRCINTLKKTHAEIAFNGTPIYHNQYVCKRNNALQSLLASSCMQTHQRVVIYTCVYVYLVFSLAT